MTENLDCMHPDDLMLFWRDHQHPSKVARRALFGHSGYGTQRAAQKLANYAANKAVAMRCRASGQIMRAQYFERLCDQIYAELPDYARW